MRIGGSDEENEIWTWVISAFLAALVGFLIFAVVMSIKENAEHEKFLKQHGCQLLMSAETGRTHLVGKITHHEKVYVYECADGTRTEVE